MFTFYTFVPHGKGWKRQLNVSANDYRAAARRTQRDTLADRVKVVAECEGGRATMGGRMQRIISFTKALQAA